jgi:hypothetical protein
MPAEHGYGPPHDALAPVGHIHFGEGMLMSGKLWAAAALVAAGLAAGSSARAGDVFKLALSGNDAPAKTLGLKDDAETILVGGRHFGGHGFHGFHRGYSYFRGYGSFHYSARYFYPRYSFGIGYAYYPSYYYAWPSYYYAPPVYYYSAPYCSYPMSLGVETSSLPGGNVAYSATRPQNSGAELVAPPVPRDSTYRYDGGPDNPVPMPKADPGPPS